MKTIMNTTAGTDRPALRYGNGSDMYSLLPVNWFDGLVVTSEHLRHADNRIGALIKAITSLPGNRPGLLQVIAHEAGFGQLVGIRNVAPNETNGCLTIMFDFPVGFTAFVPCGGVLMVLPNTDMTSGIPRPDITATLDRTDNGTGAYLVCVRQGGHSELTIVRTLPASQTIDLMYPETEVVLLKPHKYKELVYQDYRSYVPIARIMGDADDIRVDADYIPPVLTMGQIELFRSGSLGALLSLFSELRDKVLHYLTISGKIFTDPEIGAELVLRYNLYVCLGTIIINQSAVGLKLPQLSPFQFKTDVMSPLTSWLRHFTSLTGSGDCRLVKDMQTCFQLDALTEDDLGCGTDILLNLSVQFLRQLIDTVAVIA